MHLTLKEFFSFIVHTLVLFSGFTCPAEGGYHQESGFWGDKVTSINCYRCKAELAYQPLGDLCKLKLLVILVVVNNLAEKGISYI